MHGDVGDAHLDSDERVARDRYVRELNRFEEGRRVEAVLDVAPAGIEDLLLAEAHLDVGVHVAVVFGSEHIERA